MSISNPAEKRERTRLLELANEYKSKGYEVFIEPEPQQRPHFLLEFQPDLIAISESDRVVIEVKSKLSLKQSNYLEILAREVEKHKGWRLEFVLTNPREQTESLDKWELLSIPELQRRLVQVQNIAEDSQQIETAMLLLWIIVEATLQHIARREAKNLEKRSPKQLVKELFSLGILTTHDYEILSQAADFRNRIVHGYTTNFLTEDIFYSIKRIITEILNDLNLYSDEDNQNEL